MIPSLACILGLGLLVTGDNKGYPLSRHQYAEVHMGGRVEITLYASSDAQAERAARAAYARFAELEDAASDYRPQSELMRLVAKAGTGPVPVSEDLFEMLRDARRMAVLTRGSFDPTASPLVRLWRKARETKQMPDPEALKQARELVGYRHMHLLASNRTVELDPGTMLDLGGSAKGWACDEAMKAMVANGVDRAMVQAGGDLAVGEAPPGEKAWKIAILGRDGEPIPLRWQAMSTSGDASQSVEIDEVRYSHIVDPRTGMGVTNRVQVTVIARRGATTDPLATALCVIAPDDVDGWEEKFNCRIIFVREDGD
jgi:thiamine biosynthesis lipoprotein